jgi:hypothetical protein
MEESGGRVTRPPLISFFLGDDTHLAIVGSLVFARRMIVKPSRGRVRWREMVGRTRITMGNDMEADSLASTIGNVLSPWTTQDCHQKPTMPSPY